MRDVLNQILDVWSPLSHKYTLRARPGEPEPSKPAWMDEADWRRLCAYRLRTSYVRNVSRHYIGQPVVGTTTGETERDEYREYGDANLIVQQAVSAVLGDDQQIIVDGADLEPGTDPTTLTPQEQADQATAADRQDWLREWADKERFSQLLLEGERNTVSLG